jgi:hypothetical protein
VDTPCEAADYNSQLCRSAKKAEPPSIMVDFPDLWCQLVHHNRSQITSFGHYNYTQSGAKKTTMKGQDSFRYLACSTSLTALSYYRTSSRGSLVSPLLNKPR